MPEAIPRLGRDLRAGNGAAASVSVMPHFRSSRRRGRGTEATPSWAFPVGQGAHQRGRCLSSVAPLKRLALYACGVDPAKRIPRQSSERRCVGEADLAKGDGMGVGKMIQVLTAPGTSFCPTAGRVRGNASHRYRLRCHELPRRNQGAVAGLPKAQVWGCPSARWPSRGGPTVAASPR